jgi:hypothetical protein
LIQDQGEQFHSFFAETFSTVSTQSGQRQD